MTQEEIIQAISDDKMMPFIQPEQLAQIVAFVINNYQPSLPSNLDEAAKEIYKDGIQLVGRRDRNNNIVIHPETMVGVLRDAAKKGYEQAEKDLALTINDLELLHTFIYAVKNNKQGCFTFTRLSDEQYQRVLDRFKKHERTLKAEG